jgi:hypothetical protein
MERKGRPWEEFNERYLSSMNAEKIREGKEWRTKEAEAGRPSTFEDLCRVKGYCSVCHATGIALNENGLGFKLVGMDGDVQLFTDGEVCSGTGKFKPS